MPTPLQLNDEEMTILMNLAGPIAPAQRPAFLDPVAAELAAAALAGGIGATHRVAREIQRRYWDPPQVADPGPQRRTAGA
jgi:hypothetical protein